MPKIIENLRERIIAAARAVLADNGYGALSMRALARACDVAPGTIYNYFRNKDEIVATLALADWRDTLDRMNATAKGASDLEQGLSSLCDELNTFTAAYRPTWEQYESGRAASYLTRYHRTLREQVAGPVRTVVERAGRNELAPIADVLAEALLACSVNADLGTPAIRNLASALAAGASNVTGGQSGDRTSVPLSLSRDEGGQES